MTILTDTDKNRLAKITADSLSRIIFLQQPWGEFRESIPQTLTTLASRGREAQQYQFVAKPKVFASFEVVRTLSLVSANGLEQEIREIKDHAVSGLLSYLQLSLAQGIRMPDGSRWLKDYRIDQTTSHAGGLPDLTAYGDLRHTAEAIHCILQFSSQPKRLSTAVPGNGQSTYAELTYSVIANWPFKHTSNLDETSSPAKVVIVSHVLNYLFWLLTEYRYWEDGTTVGTQGTELKIAINRAIENASGWLIDRRKDRLWITDGLGPIWGSSFVLHLLGSKVFPNEANSSGQPILVEPFQHAVQKISQELSKKLVDVRQKDKLVETNLQAFLALAERNSLNTDHVPHVSRLIDLMNADSMELGESCYGIQLALILAREEFIRRAQIQLAKLPEIFDVARAKSLVASLAEQTRYMVECSAEISTVDATPGFIEAQKIAINRLTDIVGTLNPILAKYGYEPFPDNPQTDPDYPKKVLGDLERLLGRFGGYSPIPVVYPDIADLFVALLLPNVSPELDETNRATEEQKILIREIWRGAQRKVVYRSIVPGISGASVYLTSSKGAWPRVFKSGSLEIIQDEINRYKKFVYAKMPGAPLLFGPVSYGHTYALAYEYALQRAISGPRKDDSIWRPKGHPLNEIVYHAVKRDSMELDPQLDWYGEALKGAWGCLANWRLESDEINRPAFSFDRKGNGWFRFVWPRDHILGKIASVDRTTAAAIGLDPNLVAQSVNKVFRKYDDRGGLTRPARWIHGDFHPGNIFVMFSQRLTPSDRDTGKLEFDATKNDIDFDSAIPIDFANVTDGQNMWLDFGKYTRDLFERVLPEALSNISEETRLRFLRAVRLNSRTLQVETAPAETGIDESFRIAKKILKKTLGVFSGANNGWAGIPEDGKLAFLYFEISLLTSLLAEWDSKRCRNWKSKEHAYVAMLSGVDHAARLLLRLP